MVKDGHDASESFAPNTVLGIGGLVTNAHVNKRPERLLHCAPGVHVAARANSSVRGSDKVHNAGRHEADGDFSTS